MSAWTQTLRQLAAEVNDEHVVIRSATDAMEELADGVERLLEALDAHAAALVQITRLVNTHSVRGMKVHKLVAETQRATDVIPNEVPSHG